jgi:type VI secretion system secreted protein VgrG
VELGGTTLVPGVYRLGTAGLTGVLTLNSQNDPAAVFIFQVSSTLITAPDSDVVFINGASPCNVFWQIGSSATLGTDSDFIGNIMALTSITMTTGATLTGRALARNGAVTLDDNDINVPFCAPPATTPATPPATTPAGQPGPSSPTDRPGGGPPTGPTPGTPPRLPITGPGLVPLSAIGIALIVLGVGLRLRSRKRDIGR